MIQKHFHFRKVEVQRWFWWDSLEDSVRWVVWVIISCVGYNTSCFLVNFLKGCITSGIFSAIISLCLGHPTYCCCSVEFQVHPNAFGNNRKCLNLKSYGRKIGVKWTTNCTTSSSQKWCSCSSFLPYFFLQSVQSGSTPKRPIELTHGLGKSLHL